MPADLRHVQGLGLVPGPRKSPSHNGPGHTRSWILESPIICHSFHLLEGRVWGEVEGGVGEVGGGGFSEVVVLGMKMGDGSPPLLSSGGSAIERGER
ncbi:hypothetical protein LIER_41689 [Lithospermum erythrorhizon]|uniref:Uncharacterized protein n=1 Tax=Lithospermum erythrorhizon TaxID=34254 RepID=A0AAV3RH31_LITER